ncbi:MAG: DNA topoisomerase [Chryseobacterium culicis]
MKVVIAEKPSVAREIAAIIGAFEKKEGYFTGNGYQVTWALGHLVSLAMPQDYGILGFNKASLPIIPRPFQLVVRKIKKGNEYIEDSVALKQLRIIEKLIGSCESIIVATDAGREGELIFRYIYDFLKCNKPFQRLWISSLTEKAIKDGFSHLKNGHEFDYLYLASRCRSEADWLVGINASQALSIAVNNGVYSLGRVQTPALSLVCKRYHENQNFSSKTYWQIELSHYKSYIHFKSSSVIKWDSLKEAERSSRSIIKNGIATVRTVETKILIEQPPLLYDITGLQKEANMKLNFSAEETLDIAQSLYEKKFITYPRTGNKYIPEDLWHDVSKLLRALQNTDKFKPAVSLLHFNRLSKRIVNDVQVTDHHALLITEKIPSALSDKENAIYEMIAFRLLEAVSEPCYKSVTDICFEALHYEFTLKASSIQSLGWRCIKGSLSEDRYENLQELPSFIVGETVKIKDCLIQEKNTQPPRLYTEADLLSAMENAGNDIENKEERRILKNIGLGTPATRAAIIETLFRRNYILRKNKSLIPTVKGLMVYDLVKEKKIADVSMTAEWELILQHIETKEFDPKIFQKDIEKYAINITKELLTTPTVGDDQLQLLCPKCKNYYLEVHAMIIKCPDTVCQWQQFRKVCGVELVLSELKKLVTKGKTSLIKGFKSKSGQKFDAFIVLNDRGDSGFDFMDRTKNYKSS